MLGRHFPTLARSIPLHARFFTAVLSLTAALATTLSSPGLGQGVNHTGRWTPPHTTTGRAIHMTLLPGDSTQYHSEIVWWSGLNDEQGPFDGGMWGWRSPGYDCSTYPDASAFQDITPPLPAGSVFCGSDSHIATAAGTQLFVAGGTQPGTDNGVKTVFLFNPRSSTWSQADSMSEARWYATSTALATSTDPLTGPRQLVLSGSKDLSLDFFGGLRNDETDPRDRALFRYGIGYNGHREDPVYAGSGDWPTPRRGHTMVRNDAYRMFGGRDSVQYFDEYWELSRGSNTFGADHDYKWGRPALAQGPRPAARWGHSAVVTPDPAAEMIIFGGVVKDEDGDSLAVDDVWRLWRNSSTQLYEWSPVTIQPPPDTTEFHGPRCGHVAFYQVENRRMFVFGGRDSPTGTPSDSALWALDFADASFNTATWHKLSAVGPSPRYDHAGVYDPTWVHEQLGPGTLDSSYAFVFGGQLANGKSNQLWQLRIAPDTTWQEVGWVGGTKPSPRSGHTLSTVSRLLYVFGGRPGDDTVYVAHMEERHAGEQRTWTTFSRHTPALTGQAAIVEDVQRSRIPEVYDPAANPGSRWTKLANAKKLLNWYPQAFMSAADTVFVAGPDELSYKLSLSGQSWTQFPSTTSGFLGGSAVMYRPGQVMKCGSRDIEVADGRDAVGTTKRVDLTNPTAQWQISSNPMLPRVNHNLVLLPNGKVMAVGGTGKGDGTVPRYRPEIWYPDINNNGGVGEWFGADTLAPQHRIRGYHSTSLLLPCGRILSAGGNDGVQDYDVEVFCPPYLFNSDGSLATRPGLGETPRLVRYGAQDTLCRSSSDSITMVSLIRPAAVTHGFDQNQRFDSLAFAPIAGTPPRLAVTFPASPAEAPPGDYLLFVVNSQGTPSIAKWVRLVASDDVTAPAAVGDLERDIIGTNFIIVSWTAPGDHGWTGTATKADLRYSQSPITAASFCQATALNPLPAPGSGGSAKSYTLTGLQGCRTYYFALKYWDEVNNVSVFGDTVVAKTLCGPCCQEEVRAHRGGAGSTAAHGSGRPEGGAGPTATRPAVAPSAAMPTTAATGLVVEARPGSGGLDLTLFAVADEFEGHPVASDGGVLLQRPDGSGRWTDRLSYDLPADSRFALCVPEQPTRWVLLAPLVVADVLPAVGGEAVAWRLDAARHSRLGDVTATLALADSLPPLGDGDTLIVHYAAAPGTGKLSKGWMVLINRPGVTAPSIRAPRRGAPEGAVLPIAFALYQSQPNPFAERATIRFAVPAASRVKLEVFDLLGRKVRTLADRRYEPGEYEVAWDRRTTRGAWAAPGLYFYRMEAREFRAKRAMMIVP